MYYLTTLNKSTMRKGNNMNQTARVLQYLEDGKKLTCLNAFNELGITQVAARIFELKELGYLMYFKNPWVI